MSALYGIMHFDAAPVDRVRLAAMGAELDAFGPDGGETWIGEGAAMGLRVLASTSEARCDLAPYRFPRLIVAATGRLDNREELARSLGLADTSLLGDGAIIAHAYRRWREDAPARLFGDWAFAGWDMDTRRLFLARDHFGNTALHYHSNGRGFAFATSRKALFAWPHVPRRLNELRLAQHLGFWITDGAATLHEEIYRLPPGHVLRADARGIATSRYWYPDQLPPLLHSSDGEYVEHFSDLYSAAVSTRMRGTGAVATTLSGGLDSGSVTALAAKHARHNDRRLIAFTARPRFPNEDAAESPFIVDEWPLAEAVARHCGLSDHREISIEGISPLEAMRRSLAAHDEPEYAVANLDWIHGLLAASRDFGARVLLTGQSGNGGVSWTGDRMPVLRAILGGRPERAWRELASSRSQHRLSFLGVIRQQVVNPLLSAARGQAFRFGWRGPPQTDQRLINPEFYQRMRLGERMRDSGYDPFFSRIRPPLRQRLDILLTDISPIGALWHENGGAYGIEVRDPTADVRLLEFCLRIPDEQYRVGGWDRSLMRRSMRDILPSEVLFSRRSGRQATDFAARLRADAAAMDAALAQISASSAARAYLNVPGLVERWLSIRNRPDELPLYDAFAFGRGLQFGLFLSTGI